MNSPNLNKFFVSNSNSSSQTSGNQKTSKVPHLPVLWVGHLLSAAYLCVWLLVLWNKLSLSGADPSSAINNSSTTINNVSKVAFLLGWASWSYWIFCVFRIHQALRRATDRAYPITPSKAVVRMFIPGYNLFFWGFKWPREIAFFVNSRSNSAGMSQWWPGIFLAIATVSSIFVPPLRYVMAFAVTAYLVRKIGLVLPEYEAKWLQETMRVAKDRLNLTELNSPAVRSCLSAAIAAGFSFVLVQPIAFKIGSLHMQSIDWPFLWKSALRDVVEIAVVCFGVLYLIDPLGERFRARLGVVGESHTTSRTPFRLKVFLFSILAASTVAHNLLHEYATTSLLTTILILSAVAISMAVTTNALRQGALQQPSHAAFFGFLQGMICSLFFLFPLASPSSIASFGDHPVSFIFSALSSVLSPFGNPVWNLWRNPGTAPFASIIMAPSIFGLIAGLILNHERDKHSIMKKLFIGLPLAAASITILVLVMWNLTAQHASARDVGMMLAGMVAAAIAWICGLWLYDFSDLLFVAEAREQRVTNRARPRRAAA